MNQCLEQLYVVENGCNRWDFGWIWAYRRATSLRATVPSFFRKKEREIWSVFLKFPF